MKYDIGHLIDMLSILYRKKTILNDNSFDKQYKEILSSLRSEGLDEKLIEQIIILHNSNCEIWHLEADLRQGKEMPLDEIGKRAIAIREINRIRIGATNEINRLTNSGYKEVKIHHASE